MTQTRKDIADRLMTARREKRAGNEFWAGWWSGSAIAIAHQTGWSGNVDQANRIVQAIAYSIPYHGHGDPLVIE